MSNKQIGADDSLQQISITVAHSRKHKLLSQESRPGSRLHDLFDQFRVLFFWLRYVRPDGHKFQTRTLDLFTIDLHRCDDGRVAAPLQLHRQRHVWMNVAERSERV